MFPIITKNEQKIMTVPAGIHHISTPISITDDNLLIRGEEGAVLSGTISLQAAQWHNCGGGIYRTHTDTKPDRLYVNDVPYRMARYPKYDPNARFLGGTDAACLSQERIAQWKKPAGGYIHALHERLWGGFSYEITGKDENGKLTYIGGWQNNRQMGMHDEYRFVENILEELTEPGEWCYLADEQQIYVMPHPEHDLHNAEIGVNHAFFQLENRHGVTIENLTFTKGIRTFMETKEPLLRSDWTIYRGGAVYMRDCQGCTIDRCTFDDIGSNGIFVDGNSKNITVSRCLIQNIGASGICFVGRNDSVYSPLFTYDETNHIDTLDKTPGTKSDNYPKNCLVENCLITKIGTVEKQATGVEISMAYGIIVSHCTICDTSRAGINISEGTFGGHIIDGCDVFDTVKETGDHGSFNSWGRDRFWHLQGVSETDLRELSALDCLAPVTISNNRFRCDRGWDIDLDDGSGYYEIYNNLCLNGGIKLREGFCRHVYRNITVNNSVHMHVWFPDSGDIVENNIIFTPYHPIRMPDSRWGDRIDHNYLHTPENLLPRHADSLSALTGQDENSQQFRCVFRDPENGDYTLLSPELPEFTDFPSSFGVQYPPLREICPQPVMPPFRSVSDTQTTAYKLQGITVKNIETDDEMSAYGTAGHNGVLVVSLDNCLEAICCGLCIGDVILSVGSRTIRNTDDLMACVLFTEDMMVLREQKTVLLKLS